MSRNLINGLPVTINPWLPDDAFYIFDNHSKGGNNFLICSPQVAKFINIKKYKSVIDILTENNKNTGDTE